MKDEFVEITSTWDLARACILKALLQDAGIRVRVSNENLRGLIGEVPSGLPTAPRILVPASGSERAMHLLSGAGAGRDGEKPAGGEGPA